MNNISIDKPYLFFLSRDLPGGARERTGYEQGDAQCQQ